MEKSDVVLLGDFGISERLWSSFLDRKHALAFTLVKDQSPQEMLFFCFSMPPKVRV